jgi:hypothetical protein
MSIITSHWNIIALDTIPSLDTFTNVVSVIHCEKLATSEDGFNARWYGTVSVEAPHPASFIPYEDITEQMVIDWISESPSTQSVDDILVDQIDNQRNPPLVKLPLPWNSVASETIVDESIIEAPIDQAVVVEETTVEEAPIVEEPVIEETIVEENILPENIVSE